MKKFSVNMIFESFLINNDVKISITKNILLLFLLYHVPVCSFADMPIDTLQMKIYYAATSTPSTVSRHHLGKDRQVLEIGKHSSKYKSVLSELYLQTVDSMRKAKVDVDVFVDYVQHTNSGETYQVYKNYPDDGKLTWTGSFYEKIFFGYEEPLPAIEWEFLDGDTTIIDYPCKKAKGILRGTEWMVWYAMDLPYSDGPWKLCGLPGVIMKATDSRDLFSFSAIGMEQAKSVIPIVYEKRKFQKVTPLEYQRELFVFMDNEKGYIDEHILGMFNTRRDDRRLIPCLIEKYE